MKTKKQQKERLHWEQAIKNEKNKNKSQWKAPFRAGNEKKSPQQKKKDKKKSQGKAPFRAGGRRAPLPWLMTHTITITGNHPFFHIYLKLFHIMSNQTKTTTDASVTQSELGTKTSIFTMIHTESQSLPIIICQFSTIVSDTLKRIIKNSFLLLHTLKTQKKTSQAPLRL